MSKESLYGTWKSSISSEDLVKDVFRFSFLDVSKTHLYFGEGRPKEKGRVALLSLDLDGKQKELLPDTFNMRSRVHEYGGKSFTVYKDEVFFINNEDQDIYKLDKKGHVPRITKQPQYRFGDLCVTPDGSYLYCVLEDHSKILVDNSIARICLKTNEMQIVASGYDFYGCLAISKDSAKLAFICWKHPNMPWDHTELFIANISEKKGLIDITQIASGASIIHPQFTEEGVLYYISDVSSFWNLYSFDGNNSHPVAPVDMEIGGPLWVFGMKKYAFLEDHKIACIGTKKAIDGLYFLDLKTKSYERIDLPFTHFSDLHLFKDSLVFQAASPTHFSCLVKYDLKTNEYEILKEFAKNTIDKEEISIPDAVSFPTEGGKTAYGFYYPPKNKHYHGSKDEKPPVIIHCHGGPTGHTSPTISLNRLYFTSRGFGVFELNYSGSSGYGTAYRERLKKNWGVVDTQDCVNAARYLSEKGLADPNRLIVEGGSAGGFTVLGSLTFSDVFKAGACYYGVSDLEALAQDTHKFEAHYLDNIVGFYPEDKNTYIERSPIRHVEKLSCPVIFFQGTEDKVVPPSQSDVMVEALRKKKIPVSYLLFEKEAHGFRIADTIKTCVEAELFFYGKIFGFTPSDHLKEIEIENLDD